MKRKKYLILTLLLLLTTLLLSACSPQTGANTGFFHNYFVEPFTSLILGTAHFFNNNYGIAIILITSTCAYYIIALNVKTI